MKNVFDCLRKAVWVDDYIKKGVLGNALLLVGLSESHEDFAHALCRQILVLCLCKLFLWICKECDGWGSGISTRGRETDANTAGRSRVRYLSWLYLLRLFLLDALLWFFAHFLDNRHADRTVPN